MHGNVAEWCLDHYEKDFYGTFPPDKPTLQPVLLPTDKRFSHVARGGSWADEPDELPQRRPPRLGQELDQARPAAAAEHLVADRRRLRRLPRRPRRRGTGQPARASRSKVTREEQVSLARASRAAGSSSRGTAADSLPTVHRHGALFMTETSIADQHDRRDFLKTGGRRGGRWPPAWLRRQRPRRRQRRDQGRPDRLRRPRHRRRPTTSCSAAKGVKIVALGDVFEDRVNGCRKRARRTSPRTKASRSSATRSTCRRTAASSASTPTRR